MPAAPLITGGCVQVAQQKSGDVVEVVAVTPTTLQGIALLYGIFVAPAYWRRGVGRVLFGAAVARTKALKAGALMIYAEPSAEGFYKRMGAIRIGEGPFVYSPEIVLPHLLYVIPHKHDVEQWLRLRERCQQQPVLTFAVGPTAVICPRCLRSTGTGWHYA